MNKEQFLAMGYKPKEIKLECSDLKVHIREMSYKGVLAVAKCLRTTERSLIMVIYSLCDEHGNLVFTEDDMDTLSTNVPYPVIQEIACEAAKITKFGDGQTVK